MNVKIWTEAAQLFSGNKKMGFLLKCSIYPVKDEQKYDTRFLRMDKSSMLCNINLPK
jgi:hypothetical protein